MEQFTHPLAYARWQRDLTGPAFADRVRAAAARRGLRSGADRQRVRKWERGVVPDADTQHDIAEALGMSADAVEPANWPNWLLMGDREALLDLGDTARAHQLISEGRALLPPERDKARGVFLAYEAASHLELKEPEIAARTAGEALRLARRIGAPRCEALVQGLVPAFRHVRTAEGVEEFLAPAAGLRTLENAPHGRR